jgi:hypothetical protein
MKLSYLFLLITLNVQCLTAQVLDATISINGSNQIVMTINTDAKFQFNQTVSGPPSLVIDEVYATDPQSVTTTISSGSIDFIGSNGSTGTATQMGPFGFNYGVTSIRDDEITFSNPAIDFNSGDFITIKAGTIVSFGYFTVIPTINPGPYNAFIASDDYLSIAAAQVPLPVELTAFSVSEINNKIHLRWETMSETNNKEFQIEHASDGKTWEKVGVIDGKGTSLELSHYEFLHEFPTDGENYYRLKQVDYDGTFEYSKIISISSSDYQEFVIFPNPTSEKIRLKGITEGKIIIFNTSGEIVQEEEISSEEIDISALPTGIFFIRVSNEKQTFSKRILKK